MMKRLLILITCLILVFGFSAQVMAKDGKAKGKDKEGCTTIQDGTLVTTDGIIIETGYDD